jgi:hypothetical protein
MGMKPLETRFLPPEPAPVELHIEELVLDGFPNFDRFQIGDAVEQEIARLFAGKRPAGFPRQGAGMGRIDGGAFQVAPGSKERDIGIQVARSVFQSLRGPAVRGRKGGR